jgi:hypothetical protein
MLQDALNFLALVLLVLILLDNLHRLFPASTPTQPATKVACAKVPRPLRPRTADDCPLCCEATILASPAPAALPPVRPWGKVKSRRGRPKCLHTEGLACPIPDCKYRHLTDSTVHAWVGYGHHGKREPIQDVFCQACPHKFTVRRDTPLYRLKTSAGRVALVLTALAEGLSVAGAVHTFAHAERTITTWLLRTGTHAERLHGRFFRNLQLLQVQLDELCTSLRNKGHAVWAWVAFDAKSKVIAAVQMGPRTQVLAHALIQALVHVLAPG